MQDPKSQISTIAAAIMYPTPSTSPTVSCPASPPRTIANANETLAHTNNNASSQNQNVYRHAYSRKRKTPPHKAISSFKDSSDRNDLGIFQLDVYNMFFLDPKSLVFKRKSKKQIIVDATGDESSIIPEKRSLMSAVYIPDFDMSRYSNTIGAPYVLWKKGMQSCGCINKLGSCLTIPVDSLCYEQLTDEEIRTCSTLRILPDQYLHIKQTILSAAETRGPFKKRDAKSWFRIDVNKTAVLFDWFRSLGWIPGDEEWEERTRGRATKTD